MNIIKKAALWYFKQMEDQGQLMIDSGIYE